MLRWRIAVLVSTAIAISYLDRQTLPVAVNAIGKDIPLSNQQFSTLQSAFLFSYAFMYAGGGKLTDVLGTRAGLHGDHDFLVAGLRQSRSRAELRDACGEPIPAWHGRRRRFSGCNTSGGRMVSDAGARDRDGHHQCRNVRRSVMAPPLIAVILSL